MTDAESKIAAVTAKLTGQLYVGARVQTHTNKLGVVLKIRPGGVTFQWVRVQYGNGGQWEYPSTDLKLL